MCCWDWNETGTWWGWWWLILLAAMIMCLIMFRYFRHRPVEGRFCGWGGFRRAESDALRNEIRELRTELEKMKGKQGG